MISLAFWLLLILTYGVFAVWTARLILEAIFVVMARKNGRPEPVRLEASQPAEFDRAA